MKFNFLDYIQGFIILQVLVLATYGLKKATVDDRMEE